MTPLAATRSTPGLVTADDCRRELVQRTLAQLWPADALQAELTARAEWHVGTL